MEWQNDYGYRVGDEFESIEKRVTNGAAWLDRVRPGWEREIDLSALDLSEGCRCILGQVVAQGGYITLLTEDLWGFVEEGANGYRSVVVISGLAETPIHWATAHGFSLWGSYDNSVQEYKRLDEAWISLIKERFDTGNLSDLGE